MSDAKRPLLGGSVNTDPRDFADEGSGIGQRRAEVAPRVRPRESLLKYFEVHLRGTVNVHGINNAPLRQVVLKHEVDPADASMQRYKDAVFDVADQRLDSMPVGVPKQFEFKGLCRLPAIKVKVNVRAGTDVPSDGAETGGLYGDASTGEIFLCICCAARPEFSATDFFMRELTTGVTRAIPLARMSATDLSLLRQNTDVQSELRKVLNALVQRFGLDKITETRRQVAEVKRVMHQNIEAALERGEDLSEVREKTEELAETTLRFKKTAVQVKRVQRKRSCRAWCMGLCCLIVLIVIIAVPIIFLTDKNKFGKK